ncbi:hypothetical protein [Desulfovibrio sp. JC010]|uniref:hypothetical protein n=1 Tax=Desulfovibrio sp. JC010 TaxID=2593641 RepID=UPI0013D505EB|nr:hypothetical protein [Desulfovibrio sp. JC010]NDV28509.1 hypothetical protein [Desulfovibrio sp. JC010]
MNKFKIPALIFAAVFVASAAALFFYVKKDLGEKTGVEVEAPAWVNEDGSSGKMPVSGKVAKSGNSIKTTPEQPASEKNSTADAAPAESKSSKGKETNSADKTAQAPLEKAVDKLKASIITEVFLDNLAQYVADSYHPTGSLPYKAKQGFSSASLKGINMHFGLNLRGLMPEAQNLVTARKSIWDYLLAPGKMEELSKADTGTILDLIEEKGVLAERKFVEGDSFSVRELTRKQRAEMFRVSAQPLRHVAAVLKAVADNPDLIQALDSFAKAEKRVDSANGIFQLDLDNSHNSKSESTRSKAAHSGKLLKEAITIREKIKTGITQKINAYCAGQCDKPDDAFYIAQWVFRRVGNDEKRLKSIAAGSDTLVNIADQMKRRADAIEKSM